MKKLVVVAVLLLFSCNSEDAGDCFRTAGEMISREVEVGKFSRILVNENIRLVIREGAEYHVTVETGKNLVNDIRVRVQEGQLVLSGDISCNLFRDYDETTVYVTAPDISEIRNSSQWDVRSDGVLTYPELRIVSEDYQNDYQNTGDFYLELDTNSFSMVFNNLSNCFVKGKTQTLSIYLAAGNSRVDASGLEAGDISIYHRSSNDIIVNPIQRLSGDIYSTGDLISVNRPPETTVTRHYKGALIFRD